MHIRLTRHFNIYVGRDFYRSPDAWSFIIGIVDRGPATPILEFQHRIYLEVGFHQVRSRGPWRFHHRLVLIPAWWDEPTARAEYERTMRR